jgi:hypothetical protein
MPTWSHERRRVIWPDVLMAVLQVSFGAFMAGYGLVVPKTLAGHLAVGVAGLVTAAIGLAAFRFGAAATIGTLFDIIMLTPPFGGSQDDFPALVYGLPFLSLSAPCFVFGAVLMATHGDEKLAVVFFMAGIALLVLSLLVPLVRGIVKAIGSSAGEGKE